jgi:polar amino acid transport system substrate-binding protein
MMMMAWCAVVSLAQPAAMMLMEVKSSSSPDIEAAIALLQANDTLRSMLPSSIRDAGMIRVLSDFSAHPPAELWNATTNMLDGFDVDLARALGKVLNIPFQFNNTVFGTLIDQLLLDGGDVIMSGMIDSPEREARGVDYVDYAVDGSGFVVQSGNPQNIQTLLDVCGKTVTVVNRTIFQAQILGPVNANCSAAGKPNATLLQTATADEGLAAVADGRAVAQFTWTNAANYAARTNSTTFALFVGADVAPAGYFPYPDGIGIKRTNPALRDAIAGALAQVMASKVLNQILQRWLTETYILPSLTINRGVGSEM